MVEAPWHLSYNGWDQGPWSLPIRYRVKCFFWYDNCRVRCWLCWVWTHPFLLNNPFSQAVKHPKWREVKPWRISSMHLLLIILGSLFQSQNLVGCKWIDKMKQPSSGSIELRLGSKGLRFCWKKDFVDKDIGYIKRTCPYYWTHWRFSKAAPIPQSPAAESTGRFMSCQKRTLRSVATGASQLVSVNRCHSPRPLFTKLGYDSHRERGVEQIPSKYIGTLPICLALGLRDDWGFEREW